LIELFEDVSILANMSTAWDIIEICSETRGVTCEIIRIFFPALLKRPDEFQCWFATALVGSSRTAVLFTTNI